MSITPIKLAATASRSTQEIEAISKFCNWYVSKKGYVAQLGEGPCPSTLLSHLIADHIKARRRHRQQWQDGKKLLAVAIKDNLATESTTTTCGSDHLEHYRSPFEATAASRLKTSTEPPNFMVAKTRMDEFGMGSHSTNISGGSVRNIDPFGDRSAGGSSGGSAVGVSLGVCDLALGTDTGGSVRLPAAYTGVIGFKPSYGRISRFGLVPYANSLDTVGIFSREIGLLQAAFKNMQGSDPHDPTTFSTEARAQFDFCLGINSAMVGESKQRSEHNSYATSDDTSYLPPNLLDSKSLRIGVPLEYNIKELSPEVLISWHRVLKILQSAGHQLVPISLPSTKHALPAYYVLAAAEAASNLSKYDGVRYGSRPTANDAEGDVLYSQTRGLGFGDEVKRRILLGSYTLSSEAIDNHFIQAQKVRRLVQRDFDRVFKLKNPLHPDEQFDLSEMDEEVTLESKLGPPQVDFILCPTAPSRPPLIVDAKGGDAVKNYMNDVFTVPSSLAGLPSINIPVDIPTSKAGKNVPWVGMQLIGQYWDDFRVMEAASKLLQLLEYNSDVKMWNSQLVKRYSLGPRIARVKDFKGDPLVKKVPVAPHRYEKGITTLHDTNI